MRKGQKVSEEQKEKQRAAMLGRIPWNKGKVGAQVGVWKGKKRPPFSEIWKKNMGDAIRGRKHSEESKEKMRIAMIGKNVGKVRTPEFKRKVSEAMRGDKSPSWRGGITTANRLARKNVEYKLWRKSVFERDGYKCVWCGNNESGNLQADHIKQFAYYPELRYEVSNGRTLCVPCHKETDTYKKTIRV